MADRIITTYLDEHKYKALRKTLNNKGLNFEDEMRTLMETFYETTVPIREQKRIELIIAKELEDEMRFAYIRIRKGGNDTCFYTELQNSFYSAANAYRRYVSGEVGKNELYEYFGCRNEFKAEDFVKIGANIVTDEQIAAVIDFDLDNSLVSVCDSPDALWRSYDLEDMLTAVYTSEKNENASLDSKKSAFEIYLSNKELYPDDDEDMYEDTEPSMSM